MISAKSMAARLAAAAFAGTIAVPALAITDPEETPPISINGGEVEILTAVPAPEALDGVLGDTLYSGWLFRDEATQAMQEDDFDNPGMVFADLGLEAWNVADGTEGKSCADCHNDIEEGMKGVRASMPKMNADGSDLWSVENFVNDCRTNRMGAEPWDWISNDMVNMTAAISMQSRGMPVNVATDGAAAPFFEQGKEMYYTRYGQLELSCANCHEDHYGDWIRADHLSQGQSSGFPVYRLRTSGLVSLQDRFRGCIRDTRAESFPVGSQEFRALELYVASRGNGMIVEGVGVRH